MVLDGFRSKWPAALCAAVLFQGFAAGTAGASGLSDETRDAGDDSHADVYLAAGALILVGSILLLDIISDRGQEAAPEVEQHHEPLVVPTGVDWAEVDAALSGSMPLLAVSIRSDDLSGPAGALLEALLMVEGDAADVLPDLLDLGDAGGTESFEMASSFFGVSALVTVSGQPDAPGLELLTSSGILWSGRLDPDPSADADSLLTALRNSGL
jgi:hypothetical protein